MQTQLERIVDTLQAQDEVKKDFVTNGKNLHFNNGQLIVMKDKTPIIYKPSDHFHGQVADKLFIPRGYYDRMKSMAIELLDDNVNHWIDAQGKNMLIRTFEDQGASGNNTARAFLSDRFGMIDNYEVLMETLDCIKKTGINVEVRNAELSENRMYLNVVAPEIETRATEMLRHYARTIKVGDGVISGFSLQNSEVGAGSFQIAPRAVILACGNGMVKTKDALKRVHLGSRMDELEFSKNDAVVNANRKLIREQVKHAVTQFLSLRYLEKLVNEFTILGQKEIEAPIVGVIDVIAAKYDISEDRKANIMKYFIKGGDTRRIGVVNAITEECQTVTDIDSKYMTEAASYEILENFASFEKTAMKGQKNSAN